MEPQQGTSNNVRAESSKKEPHDTETAAKRVPHIKKSQFKIFRKLFQFNDRPTSINLSSKREIPLEFNRTIARLRLLL